MASREELFTAIPSLRARYPTAESFGASRIEDVLSSADRRRATVREAKMFASIVAVGSATGFSLKALPAEAQVSSLRAALAWDFDGDGAGDLLLGGNDFAVAPVIGRLDASYGLLLHGSGSGNFAPVEMRQSGVLIDGQVRHMARVRTRNDNGNGYVIVIARNNDTVKVLRPVR